MKKTYRKPQFEIHGSVKELTRGMVAPSSGDGASFRGPANPPHPQTGS